MKQDKNKTKVIFYINHTGVFAYFPEIDYDDSFKRNGETFKTCYEHIGQHSGIDPEYVEQDHIRYATPEEYQDLKEELESIGYNLEIH